VEAAQNLGISVVHIATDFLPICRRGTFIRGDGRSCEEGESIKTCSTCFVAHRTLGRLASGFLKHLSEETLLKWTENRESYQGIHPLKMMGPYLNQVAIMEKRLDLIAPLREAIDFVCVPTKYTYKMFLENGFTLDQIHYLPFGVEEKHLTDSIRHIPADHTRFLFIGRFQPYKGAHILVDAFNQLRSPKGATLTVYGIPDGYDGYYRALRKKITSNSRIRFGGKIAPDKIMSAFAESDFFVMPSLWHENSPLILLDALQSQTPVIASNIAGITDVIQDKVNGFLFPRGDQHALGQVLQRAIDEPSWRHVLRRSTSLPSINDYARKVVQLGRERMRSAETMGAKGLI
jgi:glycosyltransferase involved in cell wall biosynthesis